MIYDNAVGEVPPLLEYRLGLHRRLVYFGASLILYFNKSAYASYNNGNHPLNGAVIAQKKTRVKTFS
jgi:hypothetical protein